MSTSKDKTVNTSSETVREFRDRAVTAGKRPGDMWREEFEPTVKTLTVATPRPFDLSRYDRDVFWEQMRDNVRDLMDARGMTMKDLSRETGIPYSTLEKKMRGVHRTWWAVDFAVLYSAFDGDALLFRGLGSGAAQ